MKTQIQQLRLFSLLGPSELESFMANASPANYRDGATIIREGRDDARLIFLLSGSARVSRVNERGKEVILAKFAAGDYFGEISLLTGSVRTADVIATTDCSTLELDRTTFQRHITSHTGLMQTMLAEMAKRLHSTSERMVDNSFLDVGERLLKLLYALSAPIDIDGARNHIIRECPPHQELAAMIGASREVITRTLKQLEGSCQIAREDKTIYLPVRLISE